MQPQAVNAGGYRYTDAQLNAYWATNFVNAFVSPGSYGSAGQVTLYGTDWNV